MNAALQRYGSASHDSGVTDFALVQDGLLVIFRDGSAYLYTHEITGERHLHAMRALAEEGKGLTTYINRHVRSRFAESLTAEQVAIIREEAKR